MNVEIYLNSSISSLVGYLLEQCLETSIFNLFLKLLTPPLFFGKKKYLSTLANLAIIILFSEMLNFRILFFPNQKIL